MTSRNEKQDNHQQEQQITNEGNGEKETTTKYEHETSDVKTDKLQVREEQKCKKRQQSGQRRYKTINRQQQKCVKRQEVSEGPKN